MLNLETLQEQLQKYFNEDNYPLAVEYLESILNDSMQSKIVKNRAAYHLGRIFFYNDKFDYSEKFFRMALSFDKNDVNSKIFLGQLTENKNNYAEAIRIYASCLKTNPNLDQLFHKIYQLSLKLQVNDTQINDALSSAEKNCVAVSEYPLVSIIILCYNKMEFTAKCLASVFKETRYPNYEVIVVDNSSVDDTPAFLEAYGDKIKYIHSDKNLGFVGGNNAAYDFAEGEYLLFLNNDTEVTPNWLNHLFNTFLLKEDAGAVGSMLVYPDGKLQEAGGVIFNDATGWNYGKGGQIIDPRFSFLREVDYCSGAALMVKKSLFYQHGKFDARFAPAYFEDTDLCFGIRRHGYKVYYCPLSKVVHYEGATAGTDLNKGFKKFQMLNTPKFIDKWKDELAKQYPPNPELRHHFSNRKKGKRVLIIDDIPPFPDRAAGALRHYHTLKQMLNLGYQVTYVHLMGREYVDESSKKYFDEFRMLGVEFSWFNYESWWHFRDSDTVKPILQNLISSLELPLRNLDFIYIAFWHIADYFIDLIREQVPAVPILIDTMDVHYLREMRQAELANDKKMLKKAAETKKKEIEVYSKADCITTVTENDRDILKKELPDKSILILTDVHDAYQYQTKFSDRKDFLFIGNFNHNPNEDAVFYFVEKIFPKIKAKIKDAKFYVVGNRPSERLKKLSSNDIFVTGWVPEVKPFLEKCRVSVVPLRFGAGNKGKVGETLSHGLPMVSTTIGAEGMGIVNEVHSFVSDDPEKFAEYAVKLYTDESLWKEFSVKGQELISSQYSSELMRNRLQYIIGYSGREALKTKRALSFANPPVVSIVLITYNQYDYTKKCLLSLQKYTDVSYEIIVIDNNSSDKTVKNIKKDFPEVHLIENSSNLGFPAAVNQGIQEAIGKYVLLLNNDTEVTSGWLERMVEVAESDSKIGLVGPISNSVSGVQIDKNAVYESIPEMHKYAASVKEKNKGQVQLFPRIAFLCTLIKREVIDKIGGLDELFTPGNFEDDDFCLRAQLAGYKTAIAQDVFIHHYGSVSFKANGNNDYVNRLQINKNKFVDKWGADPEEIWLQNKPIRTRNVLIPVNKNRFIKYFESAKIAIQETQYLTAFEMLEKAVNAYHEIDGNGVVVPFDNLLNLTGNICVVNGDLEKAGEYFQKELEISPNSSAACFGLGQVFNSREMYEQAKTMLEWAVKNDKNNQKAIELLAQVNLTLGLVEDNLTLEPAVDPKPEYHDDNQETAKVLEKMLNSVYELFTLKQYKASVELLSQNHDLFYSQFNENGPNDLISSYENMKGLNLLALNDKVTARESFENALKINPESSMACSGLGEILYLEGKLREAKAMFEYGVFNQNENQMAVTGLRKTNMELGLPADDNSLLDDSGEQNPANSTSNQNYSDTKSILSQVLVSIEELYTLRHFENAIAILEQNTELFYESCSEEDYDLLSEFESLKGRVFLELNHTYKARQCFEKALQINSASSNACRGLGEILYLENNYEASKAMFEWSVANNPENIQAIEGLKKLNMLLELEWNDNSLLNQN